MAKKKPYRFPVYLLARFFAALLGLLPRKTALWLAEKAGYLAFYLIPRQRKKIVKNLVFAYGKVKPERELEVIARRVLGHHVQTAVEVLRFPRLTCEKIEQFVDYGDTIGTYQGLLKEGKGVICITAHVGNWELLAGAVIAKGVPAWVIGRRLYYEPYNRWILRLRESLNVHTIYRDQSVRRVLKVLKSGAVVGILPDQDISSLKGVFVPFFGKPAYTPVSPVKLSLMSGAPIVSAFLIRESGERYRLLITGVMRPKIETNEEAAILKYTGQWMEDFERVIRKYPEQWAWMHDRWKTKPEEKAGELK